MKHMNNKNRSGEKYLVTYDAIRAIVQDSKKFTVETGGVLVGTLTDPITLLAVGTSSEDSVHHATSFTSDSRADTECLETARRKYGNGVVVVGWWHKHPTGYDRPSIGDCRQVQSLKCEYGDDKPVLMGIVCERPGFACRKLSLRLFSLGSGSQLLEHPWELVGGASKKLLGAVSKAPAKPETRATEFWTDPNFQFYMNPIGRDRIVREVRALKQAGWRVTTTRRKSDKVMLLDLGRDGTKFCFELPPEFPLNPPTILADGSRLLGLDVLQAWNSRCCLTELAAYAQSVMNCPNCRERFLARI